jgi:hypothetical protein
MNSDVFGQPNLYHGEMSVEVDEAAVLTYDGWHCVWTSCQRADVAVLWIRDSVSFWAGYAAKSSAVSPPTVPQYLGSWYISNGVQGGLVGETVTKVGRTTGQTSGKITASCVDAASVQYPNLYTLCSQKAAYSSGGGDSGSPVFINPNEPGHSWTPRPVGMHWGSGGGSAYLSPMNQIYNALAHAYIF